MSFLDVLITRTSNGFKTFVYHELIFSGVYSNFYSFISEEYKVGLIFTLLFRTFSIVLGFSRFRSEVCHFKEILKKNAFPIKLIDSSIKNFFNKRLTEKPVTLIAEKKDLAIVSPFLGKLSLDLRISLKIVSVNTFSFVKLELLLNHQHVFPIFSNSKIKFPIASALTSFTNFCVVDAILPITAKTYRHLSVRYGEHSGVSHLTGKKSKSEKSSTVKVHMLFCDHVVSIDDFNISTTSESDFHVKAKEILLISHDEPVLNKNETSLPLYLFD